MVGNHFKKKFSKRPPPGIIVKLVSEKIFSEKIESFGTAISKKTKSYRIQKSDLISELKLDNYVEKGSLIIKLKDKDIIAPFNGILGYRGITEDVLGSDNSLIITIVIVGRSMIGNHFKKKFSKIQPPGIIVTEVVLSLIHI